MSGHRTMQISLTELFRTEVETEGKVLTDALLALERQGTAADVEQLMRAAHSIKGAARVVSMDDAVRVAHALEDFFVGVQQRGARIESGHVDVLLRAVDLLSRFAAGTADGQETQAMLEELAALREPRKTPKTLVDVPLPADVGLKPALHAMLPVFRSELATHGTAIRNELAAPQPRADVLRNAFDAIAGSARLLRIAPLAAFAAAAAKGELPPDAQTIEAILTLSQTEDEHFDPQLNHLLTLLPNVGRASARPPAPVATPA